MKKIVRYIMYIPNLKIYRPLILKLILHSTHLMWSFKISVQIHCDIFCISLDSIIKIEQS